MKISSRAKINLGLYVKGLREDGYHDILSCFYPISYADDIRIERSSRFGLSLSGLSIPGSLSENTCVRAYQLLEKRYGISPVHVWLHKRIPVGSGLGGGSSNAAAVLLGLSQIYDLPRSTLMEDALSIGSDVPFFLKNRPSLVEGRGDIIEPFRLPLISGKYIFLVCPSISLWTREVYAEFESFSSSFSTIGKNRFQYLLQQHPEKWPEKLHNVFESLILARHPELRDVKTELYRSGACYVSMTGTGSCIYGIFEESPPELFPEYQSYVGVMD
ncbi:MAG: 4-(cytidine 5'-diphospho)-2-C-methyl-D-erythritol kinase [Cytophagales bacterium]|nr:4-(cytidine 5'-diphospho)-2-C-methyl-D-erythritol kinase [Cytophagales bacterium]